MSEKTYNYRLKCFSCHGLIVIQIPFGTPASEFIAKNALPVCLHCGCNPLPPDKKEDKDEQ